MKKINTKISMSMVLALVSLVTWNVAMADTITGNLSTGLNGNVGTTVDGVVIAPPTANPPAGVYTSVQSVTLNAPGASSVRYTVDGTAPTCTTGTEYSGAIAVGSSMVLEAVSCYPNNAHSSVASYQYAINPPSAVSTNNGGGGGGGGGGSSSGGGSNSPLFSKGDSNSDGKVNITDFVTLMANWGQSGTGNKADFNGDANVGIMDFVALMANWTN